MNIRTPAVTTAAAEAPPTDGSGGDVRRLLRGRSREISALSFGSMCGGLFEAGFLVTVTRSAFAITDGDDRFGLIAGIEVSVTAAIVIALLASTLE